MTNAPPSLGDIGKQKLSIKTEEVPLPQSRKEIVSAFEGILSQGGVQKVVVEVGRPIRVSRYAPDASEPPPDMVDDELFANARNATMEEFFVDHVSFHEYLFKTFHLLSQKNLRPRAFLMSNKALLRSSLGVDSLWDLSEIFGVEVSKVDEVPPDVLLLAASRLGEEEIVLSIRLLMNAQLLKEKK